LPAGLFPPLVPPVDLRFTLDADGDAAATVVDNTVGAGADRVVTVGLEPAAPADRDAPAVALGRPRPAFGGIGARLISRMGFEQIRQASGYSLRIDKQSRMPKSDERSSSVTAIVQWPRDERCASSSWSLKRPRMRMGKALLPLFDFQLDTEQQLQCVQVNTQYESHRKAEECVDGCPSCFKAPAPSRSLVGHSSPATFFFVFRVPARARLLRHLSVAH
jgi:hypothetical protein